MPTRRSLLVGTAGLAVESLLSSCTPGKSKPNRTLPSPSRVPPVLDLTKVMANTARPMEVVEAAGSLARLWIDNRNQGRRNVVTAVHVQRGLFLSVEHLRRRTRDEAGGSIDDPIELTKYRARLAVTNAASELVVLRATKASFIRDSQTDASLFQVEDMPSGIDMARLVDLTSLSAGTALHHIGYQAAPGTGQFDTSIDKPAPKAGVRMALLPLGGSQFNAIAALGPSEGDFEATTFGQGSSGGPIYTGDGQLVGIAVSHRVQPPFTIGELLDTTDHGEITRVLNGGKDVSRDTTAQLVTCQATTETLIGRLMAGLETIPSPGY